MDHRTQTLRQLLTRLSDAQEGYREGADLAEHPTMVALLSALYSTHLMHARRLAEAMRQRGIDTEDAGSALVFVHRAIFRIRSILSGLDENILPGLIDGETRIVEAYDRALEEAGDDAPLRALLASQRATLASRIAEMHALQGREPAEAGQETHGAGR